MNPSQGNNQQSSDPNIINYSKKECKNLQLEVKEKYKTVKFVLDHDLTFDDVINVIRNLDKDEYKNLFIFTIKFISKEKFKEGVDNNNNNLNNLKEALLTFCSSRPNLVCINATDKSVEKIFYRNENESEFNEINSEQVSEDSEDFSTFFCSYRNDKKIREDILRKCPEVKGSTLILKFLRYILPNGDIFKEIIPKCVEKGKREHFLASIDAAFEGSIHTVDKSIQKDYLCSLIPENIPSTGSYSLIQKAIESSNHDIIDYLIKHCYHLIQNLPDDHQVVVSTTTLKLKQYENLCNLIKICDFPFPEKFEPKIEYSAELTEIINERKQFHESVTAENFDASKIAKFRDKNKSLKLIYDHHNVSTLKLVLDLKRYEALFYLQSNGFKAIEFDDWYDELKNKTDQDDAYKIANKQIRENLTNSINNPDNMINSLCNKSTIHNINIGEEEKSTYHGKIREWYRGISELEIGKQLLLNASLCGKLRILFDFDNKSVNNIAFRKKVSIGFTSNKNTIFIGAKYQLSDSNREQEIKGVIAHELCHYVMKLVYENNEEPYFKHDKKRQRKFKEIVEALDKWSETKSNENPEDDECDGIISGVYTLYNEKDWIAELIVRIPQILAHFDNNPEKISALEVLYKRLFQYYKKFVVPDLMAALDLEKREKIRMINKNFNTLPIISCLNYELRTPIDINAMYSNTTVVRTNIPKFLYSELNKSVQDEYGNLADALNIFVNYDKLNDDEILKNYSQIIKETKERNIFVDCTGQNGIELTKIGFSESNKFIFICSKNEQFEKVRNSLEQINTNPTLSPKDYDWHELSQKSQKALLQTEINFQNTKQKFFDILWNKIAKPSDEDNARICKGFSEIADDELLNLMADKKEISIQTNLAHETIDENFQIIFRDRNFIKKVNFKNSVEIPQKDLIPNTQKDPFVLISDIAGTGKSWAMKMITKMLREQTPTKWITYIDLKQFMKDFEAQKKNELNFLNFMIEKVFDFKKGFESKMFKELYKNGHVCILLDGFDEISPNYAEIVKKLIESFKQNGGNQMWIATRDFFEVNLQKHLNLDASYKLVDFRDEDGYDIIVRNCVLADLKSNKIEITKDFNNQVKDHSKYQIYYQAAKELHQKISNWSLKSIGLPQLFKMIGDVLIAFQDSTAELIEYTLYDKVIDHLFERWYSEKGELRKQKCIDNQKEGMNYRELHEFCAMKSLFPENSCICDVELDKDNWNDEEIVGGGILNKKSEDGDEFLFPHETYREFFAASFIIRILKKKPRPINLDVLKYLIKFCLNKKYGVIQMFLRQGFKDVKALPRNKMMIVSTNVPKLLQINIYQHIQKENKNTKNIFVIPDDPNSNKLCEDFGDDFIQNSNLNSMVKPQKDFGEELKKLEDKNSVTIIIIVPSEERGIEVSEILQQFKFEPKTLEMKYDWNDLTEESQDALLQSEVNIDNHSKLSFFEFISDENAPKNNQKAGIDFSTIITNELLNLVVNKSQIKVNGVLEYEMEQKTSQLLFLQRSFINKDTNKEATKKSVEQLLDDVNHEKYVLLSDVTLTGKSIAMQNITNTLRQRYPRKWITYIDLKRFRDQFKSHDNGVNSEFSAFVLNNFLKFNSSNCKNINSILSKYFIKLYKAGMIIFLFDEFDEIAPNCAEFVTNLSKSLHHNGGNQLWISTRDYLEENLLQTLNIGVIFKLDDINKKDGINLAAKNWLLNIWNNKKDSKEKRTLEEFLNDPEQSTDYYKKCIKIIEKISYYHSKNNFTYLIFALVYSKSYFYEDIETVNHSEFFIKLTTKLYARYSQKKGEISRENITRDHWIPHGLYSTEFRSFHAILILFPNLAKSLFPYLYKEEFPKEKVIPWGFMNFKDGEFIFLHYSFCYFFAAEFIYLALMNGDIRPGLSDILIRVTEVHTLIYVQHILYDFVEKHFTADINTLDEFIRYRLQNQKPRDSGPSNSPYMRNKSMQDNIGKYERFMKNKFRNRRYDDY